MTDVEFWVIKIPDRQKSSKKAHELNNSKVMALEPQKFDVKAPDS